MARSIKTVLCIPGLWPTRSDLVASIAKDSNGFILAGGIVLNLSTAQSFACEVRSRDPQLRTDFEVASLGRLDQQSLESIEKHTHVVYLVNPGGSTTVARSLMAAGAGIVHAGGLAVNVLSAGVAHNAPDWIMLAATPNDIALYHAYVTLVNPGGRRVYYSCGMHNLGLRDAIVSSDQPPGEVAELLQTFLLYTLIEKPELVNGHTFSLNGQARRYELRAGPCTTYPPDTLLYNPLGKWQLVSHPTSV